MPNWKEVLDEISDKVNEGRYAIDNVRRKYLAKVSEHTNRNVIAYYSGWQQRPQFRDAAVNDKDVSGFMLNIHRLEKERGLDIILHTPGGDLAATEALVNYLRSMFGNNIRAIIPQISMSAGTMIALSTMEVIMGKHSSLGPIDPQIGGVACKGVVEEFEKAKDEIKKDPQLANLWQFILGKYTPTYLGKCYQAISWSEELVTEWLNTGMCNGDEMLTASIVKHFSDHASQKSHARHISYDQCDQIGLNVTRLEEDQELQDLVLTTHHAFMHTLSHTSSIKIIENHLGIAYIESVPVVAQN